MPGPRAMSFQTVIGLVVNTVMVIVDIVSYRLIFSATVYNYVQPFPEPQPVFQVCIAANIWPFVALCEFYVASSISLFAGFNPS